MKIPPPIKQLHVADPLLHESPGEETVVSEGTRLPDVRAIGIEGLGILLRDVGQLGNRGLHPERHLILGDAGVDLRIREGLVLLLVQF